MLRKTDDKNTSHALLDNIPANYNLIEKLYSHDKISREAKEYALNIIYPNNHCSLWISRLLLVIGTILILSGVIFFTAFNWNKLTPLIKFSFIQLTIIICIIISYLYSLESIIGKLFLLSASIFIGVFLIIFGQIYQIQVNYYQLFMLWSILVLPWTIICNYSPLWIIWLIITNLSLALWRNQQILGYNPFLLLTYHTIFNSIILLLHEYFVIKHFTKLPQQYIRILLIIFILSTTLVPIMTFIFNTTNLQLTISTAIGIIAHGVIFFIYRYKQLNIGILLINIFSINMIVITTSCKIVSKCVNPRLIESYSMLTLTVITPIVFTIATNYIKKIINIKHNKNNV